MGDGVRRTVVLHPGALGDVLLSIPALRALGADAPDHELVLAAQPRIGRMLEALAVVDRHVVFDTLGVESLFADEPPSERLVRLCENAQVVSWFGHADAGFARRLRALAPDAIVAPTAAPEGATVWQHLLASVASVPAATDPVPVPRAMVDDGLRALREAGWDGARPLVVLHPGAGGAAKRWATDGFAQVVDALGADVAVHDGPADHDAVAALRVAAPAIRLVEPALETLVGVMRHAALWLGNDSGVTHLAAAVGTPTLALFIAPHLAWRPWSPRARVRVISVDALARADVEAVIADARDLLGAREARAERSTRTSRGPTRTSGSR